MVNRAIEDFVTSRFGDEVWQRLLDRAGSPVRNFARVQQYPDQLTYDLVGAAVEILATPVDEVLRAFGRHWIFFAARNGYGAMLGGPGTDLADFLRGLDAMHARIALAMPELNPPSFRCLELGPGHLELHYTSARPGLAVFVLGLLDGLAERFGYTVRTALRTPRGPGEIRDVFDVWWSA
jgi:hypothetical protein